MAEEKEKRKNNKKSVDKMLEIIYDWSQQMYKTTEKAKKNAFKFLQEFGTAFTKQKQRKESH